MNIPYPKTVKENTAYRRDLFLECEKDPLFAATVREIFRRDILFAFNSFFWTYDPRPQGEKDLPFVTWVDFQDETVLEINRCIEVGEGLFMDKSRDMGVTYMVLYVYLWRFLTKKSEEFRIGSRKEDYVDKSGDMDALFEKLRYCLKLLPKWILPVGFSVENKRCSTYMKLFNPELNSAIIGEATNADFARGGRKKSVLFDEFSAWEMAEEAWKAASDSTRCKIAVGTPKGAGNKFAELSRTTEVKNKLHLMWWRHPNKAVTSQEHLLKVADKMQQDQSTAPKGCYVDITGKIRSEWYDNECEHRTPDDVAENLDCNYLTSGRPVFDTLKCEQNRLSCEPPRAIGQLIWKIHPKFSEHGDCINLNQLTVEFVPNVNGNVKIWEYPEEGWQNGYCIAADCAEGLEQGDYDSAGVLKRFVEKPKTVARLHGHLKPFEYAEELSKLGYYYKGAYITVEREGHSGGAVIENLRKIYRHLFHKEVMTKGFPEMTDRIGWFTNSMTKPIIIGHLSKCISNGLFEEKDEELWRETLTYVNNDGKMEAQGKSQGQKCFDDRIMELAINLWCHTQLPLPSRIINRTNRIGWRKSWDEKPKGNLIRFAV